MSIECSAISFTYPGRAELFNRFTWQIQRGQSWVILGPSGCGKTTLLYLLAGLQQPSVGQISLDGEILSRPRPQTGLILQDYGLLPWATVEDNIRLGQRIRQFYGPDGLHAPQTPTPVVNVKFWLERLGLAGLELQFPGQLSGGQRQRVAIARTLVLQPDLLLMDEPFASLDLPTRHNLEDLTIQLWREQRFTLVVVTHAIEEAAALGQFILVMGKPPHAHPTIVANPVFNQPDARESDAYRSLCRELKTALEAV